MERELYEYILTLDDSIRAVICDEILWLMLADETVPDPNEDLVGEDQISKLLNLVAAAVAERGK